MDFPKVSNPKVKNFLATFFLFREINREFYNLVLESQFDFRMVDNPQRRSDSIRENLAHQINVEKAYIESILNGVSKFDTYKDESLKTKSKKELLKILEETDRKLIDFLSDNKNLRRKVITKWSKKPIISFDYLWGLIHHEILHNGINIGLMDYLNIPHSKTLKQVWG